VVSEKVKKKMDQYIWLENEVDIRIRIALPR
jgi:hypothetical protein